MRTRTAVAHKYAWVWQVRPVTRGSQHRETLSLRGTPLSPRSQVLFVGHRLRGWEGPVNDEGMSWSRGRLVLNPAALSAYLFPLLRERRAQPSSLSSLM